MSLGLDKSTWQRVTFGDVARNVNETVKDAATGAIDRLVAMEHMDPGKLMIERWGGTANGTTFTRRVRPGQTLFGKRRAYQRKVAYAEFDAICSGDIYAFEADATRMLGEFLPFLVQSDPFFDHALCTSAGSLSPRTNWRDLADFEFNLPPLEEQKRIADLLWATEKYRRALEENIRQLADADAAWTRNVFATLEWDQSLSDVISAYRPLCYGVVQPGRDTEGGVGLIRVLDLESGAPELHSLRRVAAAVDAQYRRSRVQSGDVLVSIVGTIGRSWIVTEEFAGCNIARALARLSTDPSRMLPAFLKWVLSSDQMQESLGAAAFESARKTLNLSALSKIQIPHLTLCEQSRLLATRNRFTDAISAGRADAAAVEVLRRSLLTEIFGAS